MPSHAEPPVVPACPFCGESLHAPARVCPHCDEDLSSAFRADFARAIEEATREDAAGGRFDPGYPRAFRRFRVRTIVCGSILVVCLLLAGTSWGKPPTFATGMGRVGALFLAIPALILGTRDLLLRSPARLTTSRSVFETYVRCLKEKRWEYAFSLVLPRGREGEHRRPPLGEVNLEEASVAVDSPAGLAAYWSPLLHGSAAVSRSFRAGPIRVDPTGPDTAVAACVFRFSTADLVGRSSVEVPFEMPLMKVEGRWYLVDAVPAIPSP